MPTNALDGLGYSADQAISDPRDDRFQRLPFAQRLATTVAQQKDPSGLILGLYGAWGEGKSSVLNLLVSELARYRSSILVLNFNPWRFSSEVEVARQFFEELTTIVDSTLLTTAEKLGEWVKKNGGFLSLGGWIDVGKLGDSLAGDNILKYRRRVEAALHSAGKRVVVIMDDIDRLDKSEIQTVFRLVKLSANFEHVTYVLAFDDQMVAAALADRYAGPDGGRAFLEKIIQVPLRLPRPDEAALRQMVFEGIDAILTANGITLSKADSVRYRRLFIQGLSGRLSTPRAAHRYLNAVRFAVPMLKGDVNPVDLVLVEGLRVFFPRLYEVVREHKDLVVDNGDWTVANTQAAQVLGATLESFPTIQQDGTLELLRSLFPGCSRYWDRYSKIFTKDLEDGKHVASRECFDRYFSYTRSSDSKLVTQLVAKMVRLAERGGQSYSSEEFMRLVTPQSQEKVLETLSLAVQAGTTVSCRLATMLAENAWLFSYESTRQERTPLERLADTIGAWINGLSDVEVRRATSLEVIKRADPFRFVPKVELHFDESPEILKAIAERVRVQELEYPLYRCVDPSEAFRLYGIWNQVAGHNAAGDALAKRFDESPSEMAVFVSTAFREDDLYRVAPKGLTEADAKTLATNKRLLEAYKTVVELVPDIYDRLCNAYEFAHPDRRSLIGSPLPTHLTRAVLQVISLEEAMRHYPAVFGASTGATL